ncbi:hypothetical protein WH87_04825 [Devosia epidermidihirudinis]|uniref:VRR-NUC domain-containing protein n=1 Tax=Devosia epidermidihirudinis TaxID=1293439 RepID=A0A0F5QEX7_9HYPH|nr:VRR-NUC domain-containing protein [Devosia epidermidihirudinis]KKC39520.1 hypothetical protein WH87_04825 [Devosia epidermidihirudinis]
MPPKVARSAFERLSLRLQCEELAIPLTEMDARYDKASRRWYDEGGASYRRPEPLVAASIRRAGFEVAHCEGTALLMPMKALTFDWFLTNYEADHSWMRRWYFEGMCKTFEGRATEIRRSMARCQEPEFASHFDAIMSVHDLGPEAVPRNLALLLAAHHRSTLLSIFDIFASDPYAYRAGWPDIVAVSETELRFVEVKTADRFHASQERVARAFRDALGLDFSVVRLKPKQSNWANNPYP